MLNVLSSVTRGRSNLEILDLIGEFSILVLTDQSMPIKADILCKNYLLIQSFFFLLFGHAWLPNTG